MAETYTKSVQRYRLSEKGKKKAAEYRNSAKEKARVAKRNGEARRTPEGWKKEKIRQLRHRAKKNGLEFNLTVDDLIIPDFCPVFGTAIILDQVGDSVLQAMKNPDVASVDRTDNTKGYVKGNIQIMSNRANLLKRDGTLEEFEKIVSYLRGLPSLA